MPLPTGRHYWKYAKIKVRRAGCCRHVKIKAEALFLTCNAAGTENAVPYRAAPWATAHFVQTKNRHWFDLFSVKQSLKWCVCGNSCWHLNRSINTVLRLYKNPRGVLSKIQLQGCCSCAVFSGTYVSTADALQQQTCDFSLPIKLFLGRLQLLLSLKQQKQQKKKQVWVFTQQGERVSNIRTLTFSTSSVHSWWPKTKRRKMSLSFSRNT